MERYQHARSCRATAFGMICAIGLAAAACGSGGGSTAPASGGSTPSNSTPATVIQIYKNGFYYPWGGANVGASLSNGAGVDPKAPVSDNITGDANVLLIMQAVQAGLLSGTVFLPGNTVNAAQFYASGHLQFNIRLAPGIQFQTLSLRGYSGIQFGTFPLPVSSYSTSTFVHVSIPIASLYPPASISTAVQIPFYLTYTVAFTPNNTSIVYLNDIKWTSN